jgi:hypothetical protein
MSKQSLKKLTFDDIIAKKLQREQDKFIKKEIEIPSMGGTLLFEKPQEEDVLNAIDMIGDGNDINVMVKAYDQLIYNCCPTLKDPKLHEQLDITVPTDIVKAVMELSDRMLVGNELVALSGIGDLGNKIKKS